MATWLSQSMYYKRLTLNEAQYILSVPKLEIFLDLHNIRLDADLTQAKWDN